MQSLAEVTLHCATSFKFPLTYLLKTKWNSGLLWKTILCKCFPNIALRLFSQILSLNLNALRCRHWQQKANTQTHRWRTWVCSHVSRGSVASVFQFTLTYTDTRWNSCVTTLFHHNNKQRLNGPAVRQPRTATHNGTEQHERGGNLQRWVLSPHCSGFIEFTLLHLSAHTHWLTTATTEEHRSHRRRLTLITDETSHWGCTLEASPVRSDCRLRAWAIIQSLGYVVWQIPLLFRWIIIILVWHVCSLQWLTPKVVQKQGSYFLQATIDLARWNVNCC